MGRGTGVALCSRSLLPALGSLPAAGLLRAQPKRGRLLGPIAPLPALPLRRARWKGEELKRRFKSDRQARLVSLQAADRLRRRCTVRAGLCDLNVCACQKEKKGHERTEQEGKREIEREQASERARARERETDSERARHKHRAGQREEEVLEEEKRRTQTREKWGEGPSGDMMQRSEGVEGMDRGWRGGGRAKIFSGTCMMRAHLILNMACCTLRVLIRVSSGGGGRAAVQRTITGIS